MESSLFVKPRDSRFLLDIYNLVMKIALTAHAALCAPIVLHTESWSTPVVRHLSCCVPFVNWEKV